MLAYRRACLLAVLATSFVGGTTASTAVAAALDDQEGRRLTNEFNRGLDMVRNGNLDGLKIAKKAYAGLEAALGADHPTTKQASATLLLTRFQVRGVRQKLALQNTKPTGPKMTSSWALGLARELRREGEQALAAGDTTGIKKLEQAYIYVFFAIRDPLNQVVAEYSGTLSSAYKKLGQPDKAEGIEDGDIPPGQVPDILLSMEIKTLYEQADAAERRQDWQAAATAQAKLVALLERELGPDSEEMLQWWSSLASYLAAAGRLDEAESVLARSEKMVMQRYGPTSQKTRDFYALVANHFMARGDVKRANLYRQKNWELARKAPKTDPNVIGDLINLADTMVSRRKFDEATKVIADIEARLKILKNTSPAVRLRLVNIKVGLLGELGKTDEARQLLAESEKLADSIDDRSSKFLYHRTAAEFSQRAGEFPTAARHYKRAGEVGSIATVVTSGMFEQAAMMYWAAGRVDDAVAMADKAGTIMDEHLPTLLLSGTDAEKRQQLLFANSQKHSLLSLSVEGFPQNSAAAEIALRTITRRKAIVLDAITRTGEVARTLDTNEARTQLQQQRDLRERLAAVVYHPSPGDFYDDEELKKLLAQADQTERALAKTAQSATVSKPSTLDDIRGQLPADGALVEFVTYRQYDPKLSGKDQQDIQKYAALVLPKSGPVVAIPLAGVAEIDGRVATLRKALSTPKGKYKQPARGLYDATIGKLAPHLKGVKHLVIAPSGQLNLVPFAALLDADNKFLLDTYTLTYVSSGRELVRSDSGQSPNSPAVLVGTPAFNDAGDGATAEGKRLKFSKLPGTAEEVAALGKLVPKAEVWTETDASERKLKQVDRPVLLHIATHGFFLDDKSEALNGSRALVYDAGTSNPEAKTPASPTWSVPENPLLRSGLALSGANKRIGGDDGILTALEVASMDLRGTELVVLSACETGVGDVESGEGVYGLRRAMTIAGTRSQVMSLWKVDDAATRDLMVGFYEKLAKGTGRGQALREAQRELRKQDRRQHPYYWAAFIPSGAWGPMALEPKQAVASSSSSSSKRGSGSVRDYWRNPPSQPIAYFGGHYSAPFSVDPFNGRTVDQRNAFGVEALISVAPRWLVGFLYRRSMWDVAAGAGQNAFESKLGSFELTVGVDALGLPRGWRVRPSLNAWVGGGLAWTKQTEAVDNGDSDRAIGLAGTIGADAQLHIRFTDRFDMKLGGGVTKSGYALSDDTIAGAAKFPGKLRWMAGGAFGFVF